MNINFIKKVNKNFPGKYKKRLSRNIPAAKC